MKRLIPICFALVLTLTARADVVEFQNGDKKEGRILGYFRQRFEFADKAGTVTHPALRDVKRVEFVAAPASIITSDHKIVQSKLVLLENGTFTLENNKGERKQVAAEQVQDFTVTDNPLAPSAGPATSRARSAAGCSTGSAPDGNASASPVPGKITIIDFYADWCGPCRAIGPVLADIAANDNNVALKKVNIDNNHDLARQFKVNAIPNILIYDKNGKKVATVIGANADGVQRAVAEAKNRN